MAKESVQERLNRHKEKMAEAQKRREARDKRISQQTEDALRAAHVKNPKTAPEKPAEQNAPEK